MGDGGEAQIQNLYQVMNMEKKPKTTKKIVIGDQPLKKKLEGIRT